MYRIKLQSGEESEFGSFEELCFGIVSGIIGPDDEIYHARASKWLPIQTHPDYKRAVAQAPPPSPAMASQSSASPVGGVGSHGPPDEEAGQDLMTLLDLEELTAFNPGKVQESAPLKEAEPEAETAELEPIEAQEPEELETNGHAGQGHPEADQLDEPAADTEDATALEALEPAAEVDADNEADESREAELSSDDDQLAGEPARAELDIDKETEFDDRDEATMAELALSDEEAVAELEDHDSETDDAEPEQAESQLGEVDAVMADEEYGSRDIDYVAAEYQDDVPTIYPSSADLDTTEDQEVHADEPDVADLNEMPATEQAEDSQDIDCIAAEDVDDVPMMELAVAADKADVAEDENVEEVSADEEALQDDEPVVDPATPALLGKVWNRVKAKLSTTLEIEEEVVEEEVVEETADLEYGDTDEDVESEAEPATEATLEVEEETIEDEEAVEDHEAVAELPATLEVEEEIVEDNEPISEPNTFEADDEVVEEAADLEDDDSDEDVELEVETVGQADDDEADDDPLLGGLVIELDHPMDAEPSDADADAGDELEPAAELVATAEAADPIDAFQPAMDDDLFQDTFSPVPELDSRRRFPVLPVAIAAGVVAMAALGWILMGSSGSEEPAAVVDPPTPAPAAVPAASANLNQQSLAAEDPSEEMQRRYDEAYDRARSRLDADLRRAGFAAVFAPGNFAGEDSMVTARAGIAAASLAVSAYAGREQSIRDDFPDADPTGRESRAHRELSEDLLAVSQQIYGLLLANREAFALRNGAMTITDPAVESEYTRLVDEVNRLMRLAATADEARAATVRRIAAAIGNTRPPPLAQLAPPPALPTDL